MSTVITSLIINKASNTNNTNNIDINNNDELNNSDSDNESQQHILTPREQYELMVNKQNILNKIIYKVIEPELYDFYETHLAPTKFKRINLDPPYQRKFIWSSEMQDKYIDSLINNYVLQPIILIEIKDDNIDDSTNYYSTLKHHDKGFDCECIDGRHRLKVIKAFMENIPVNNDSDKCHNVRYIKQSLETNIKSKKYNTIVKKKISFKDLEDSDKLKFNKTIIPITRIIIRINTKDNPQSITLLKSILKDMFLRLQTGVCVTAIDKFKNSEEPIVEALHYKNLLMMKTFKRNINAGEINKIWVNIPEIIEIPKPTLTGVNTSELAYITLFIITCLLIIQKQTYKLSSYMQINIFTAIHKHHTPFNNKDDNINTVAVWVEHLKTLGKFLTRLTTLLEHHSTASPFNKLDKNIIYMLLYQYIKSEHNKDNIDNIDNIDSKFIKYINYIDNIRKIFYNGKSIFNKSPAVIIDSTNFKYFIDIIDTNLLCSPLSCDVLALRKDCNDQLLKSKKQDLAKPSIKP